MFYFIVSTNDDKNDEEVLRIKEQSILELGKSLSKSGRAVGLYLLLLLYVILKRCYYCCYVNITDIVYYNLSF